jgi:hypothetical protein
MWICRFGRVVGRRVSAFGVSFSLISISFLSILLAVSNISQNIRATTWNQEIELSTDAVSEIQFSPHVALEGNNIYAVWSDGEDGEPDVYFTYHDGMAWQPEQEVTPDWPGIEFWVSSVAVGGGRIHVILNSVHIMDWDILYTYFDGMSWQPVQEVNVDIGTAYQEYPMMSVNGSNVHAVWMDDGDGDEDILYRFFDGTSWQTIFEVSSDGGTERQSNPSIAVDGNEAHVVWVDEGGGDWDIYYRHFNGMSWQPEMELSTDSGGEWQRQPQVVASGGKVHVVWVDEGGGDFDIFYRHFDGIGWQPEQEISADVTMEMQETPGIVVEGDSVHVTWVDRGGGDPDIFHRFFNGTSWRPVEEVSTDAGAEWQVAGRPAVLGGKLHVIWMDQEDGDWDIYYRNGTEAVGDMIPPNSFANPISPYWQPDPTFDVGWTATDDWDLANVSLHFRYSPDNVSWGGWQEWAYNNTISGTVSSGSFPFTAVPGDGFYEFYTIASDSSGNVEATPAFADAIAEVDTTPIPPFNTNAVLSGNGFENVTLTWGLSPDDGAGKNNIERYDIYKGTTYDPSGTSYVITDSFTPGTNWYEDLLAGEGDPNNYFYLVCAVGFTGTSACSSFQAAKYTRPLTQGTNLISFPVVMADEAIEVILQTVQYDKAWTYDTLSGNWKSYSPDKPHGGLLKSADHIQGIWVDVTSDCNFTTAGAVFKSTAIQLYAGWNLIGFPSFNSTHAVSDLKAAVSSTRMEGYDPLSPYHLRVLGDAEVLQAGYGYWIWVDTDRGFFLSTG